MRELGKLLGISNPQMVRNLKSADLRVSLLMAMSDATGINLFDIYLQQLPPDVQPTNREHKLDQQLADLQSRYDQLQEKVAWIEKFLMKT